jgi:hypothetical protein
MSSRRVARLLTQLGTTDSPSAVYAALAAGMPSHVLVAFGSGVCRQLKRELNSIEAVGRWAVDLAARIGRPVLLNFEFKDGSSRTFSLAPPGWSQERLAGYVAGHHKDLELMFGPIERIRSKP